MRWRSITPGGADGALRWIVEARSRAVRNSGSWAALVGAILVTEAELRLRAGDEAGADAAARDALSLAARVHLDGLLPSAVAIVSR